MDIAYSVLIPLRGNVIQNMVCPAHTEASENRDGFLMTIMYVYDMTAFSKRLVTWDALRCRMAVVKLLRNYTPIFREGFAHFLNFCYKRLRDNGKIDS